MKLKIFLDTNVLLDGFAAFRNQQTLPAYAIDPSAERYTFEKCVFEVYMTFRGVVGRKPSEGRGRWAESHLRAETDPSSVGKLTSQIHDGDRDLAFFWINQILEAGYCIDEREQAIETYLQSEDRSAAYATIAKQRQLVVEREKFDHLCNDFKTFLEKHTITLLSYGSVFDITRPLAFAAVHPAMLDGFVRDTVFPNEDFEIVFAALSLPADVFVTNDTHLITCAKSLGLNFPLAPDSFCTGADYLATLQQVKVRKGVVNDL